MRPSVAGALLASILFASPSAAQQRPLVTEDPETIGAGHILLEAGIDFADDQEYPVSGLKGNLWRVPAVGISVGLSSIAELQFDGGLNHLLIASRNPKAPLASALTVTGDSTHDVEDIVVATKIRIVSETPGRPAFGVRFATKLPNASNEKGLGLDTTDFFVSMLVAKTIESIRMVGNLGLGILTDPTSAARQNDVLTYGVSFARAVTSRAEVVGELNGRASTRDKGPLPGTESRALFRLGTRYTYNAVRVDGAVFFGLTSVDPTIGFTAGLTYVFNGFRVP
jgi:hypothetical protein